MYSYEEYNYSNFGSGTKALEQLLSEEQARPLDPAEVERVKYGRTFKTGDWVTYNHYGEYPKHISREPWQITHWSFQYNTKTGSPLGRIHKSAGMAHSEDCLRYAHPDEIEYYKSGLPWIYNKRVGDYEKIEIFDGGHFKIGSIIDSRALTVMNGAQLLTILLELEQFLSTSDLEKKRCL